MSTTVQDRPDKFAVVATVDGRHQLWGTAGHDDADRLFDALKVSRRLDFGPHSGNHLRVMPWQDWCKVRVGLGLGEEPVPASEPDALDEADEHRAKFLAALRELASFLVAHPDVPVYPYMSLPISFAVSSSGGDEAAIERVRAAAAALGVEVNNSSPGHWQAQLSFGAVEYGVSYMERGRYELYRAAASYEGAVEPDGGTTNG